MPLPPLTPGTSAKPGSKLPTHLYKRGRIGGPTKLQDHFQIGDWVEGKPGEVAVWTPTPNIPFQARGGGVLVDEGLYYGKRAIYTYAPETCLSQDDCAWCSGDCTTLLMQAACNLLVVVPLPDPASKDFWDPVKKRRILWGWSTGGSPKGLQCSRSC